MCVPGVGGARLVPERWVGAGVTKALHQNCHQSSLWRGRGPGVVMGVVGRVGGRLREVA